MRQFDRHYHLELTSQLKQFVTDCLEDACVLSMATKSEKSAVSAECLRNLHGDEGQNWSNGIGHAYMERKCWSDWPERRLGLALLIFHAQLLVNDSGKRWIAKWVTVIDRGQQTEVPGILLYRPSDQSEVPMISREWGLKLPFIVELEPATFEEQVPSLPPEETGLLESLVVLDDWLNGSEQDTPMRNYLDRNYIPIDLVR